MASPSRSALATPLDFLNYWSYEFEQECATLAQWRGSQEPLYDDVNTRRMRPADAHLQRAVLGGCDVAAVNACG
jgi:hypothetical protein